MRCWTPEERKRQAQLIHDWKPWDSSTGAKTKLGKETAKMNALKHGLRSSFWKSLKQTLKKQRITISKFQERFVNGQK